MIKTNTTDFDITNRNGVLGIDLGINFKGRRMKMACVQCQS
ncbi:hypothetical protein COO91_03535 [Nostoc flagelliforme CCNUN1]|uniref:Uncharacterized protein n=1 Tax=Nostoc flagelliforme CCNUN1 TaxID=2038116 RepID=A0A2K8SQ46_9NOSO|nr:hypothetical protein COO91_03535 [Nostoc flagelliforme CCNUN1]